mmetsp:Transcript_1120/g.2024  ORF Transcript_1120/g.2024 Transcript_1120/m.2024 type:complete len:333 (+) Transcript_1120:120-1118(+)
MKREEVMESSSNIVQQDDHLQSHKVANTNTPIREENSTTRSRSVCCKSISRIPAIIFIIAGSAISAYVVSYFWDDLDFGSKTADPANMHDDWNGGDLVWENDGNGLSLTLINSLTNDWDPFLLEVVKDWNTSPALSLNTKVRKYDLNPCGHRNGELRVCNLDYGKTGWKGVNEAMFYTSESDGINYIVSSVAKMNDYYLAGKSNSEKQYVMCHELGHGLGLDHRDEAMDNPDLGSCMDYTRNYAYNMRPDNTDFEDLFNLYGIYQTKLRKLRGRDAFEFKTKQIPINYDQINFHDLSISSKGRLLMASDHQKVYELDLGNGFKALKVLHLAR